MPVSLTGNTTTLAGNGATPFQDSTDGTGATAQFNFPRGLATDGSFLYLTESTGRRIRKINPATGETTNLAGDGTAAHQDSTDGTGATARFVEPRHIVYLRGFLHLADIGGNRIRRIHPVTGATTTLAGDGTAAHQDSTDGTGATARFNAPSSISSDGTFLYVVERDAGYLRRVERTTGNTTTIAGNGVLTDQESSDGTGATAGFSSPFVIQYAAAELYVGNNTRISRAAIGTGNTTFFAGGAIPGFQDSTDGTGATAQFATLLGSCTDGFSLFWGDGGTNRVRKVALGSGNTTTVAGDGTAAFQDSTDGTGATARFSSPRSCVVLNDALYVADGGNHRVRKID